MSILTPTHRSRLFERSRISHSRSIHSNYHSQWLSHRWLLVTFSHRTIFASARSVRIKMNDYQWGRASRRNCRFHESAHFSKQNQKQNKEEKSAEAQIKAKIIAISFRNCYYWQGVGMKSFLSSAHSVVFFLSLLSESDRKAINLLKVFRGIVIVGRAALTWMRSGRSSGWWKATNAEKNLSPKRSIYLALKSFFLWLRLVAAYWWANKTKAKAAKRRRKFHTSSIWVSLDGSEARKIVRWWD